MTAPLESARMPLPAGKWDAVVIGAGPAGALAALLLAQRGLRTLLVERRAFPRAKTCGGCLNARALAGLRAAGLAHEAPIRTAPPLHTFELHAAERTARLLLPAGCAVERSAFDAWLVQRACGAGATFAPQARASVGTAARATRRVTLQRRGDRAELEARVVVAADGLGGTSLDREPGLELHTSAASHAGASCALPAAALDVPPGTIAMHVGRSGYVGVVALADGRLNIAAAMAPAFMRAAGSAGRAAAAIVAEARGQPLAPAVAGALHAADWQGTPPLTRSRRCVAGDRLFVVGDAGGYVEPFTGEGMAWAIESALAVAPLAASAVERWSPALAQTWSRHHRAHIAGGQRFCRIAAAALRRPWVVALALHLLRIAPGSARPAVHHINRIAAATGGVR